MEGVSYRKLAGLLLEGLERDAAAADKDEEVRVPRCRPPTRTDGPPVTRQLQPLCWRPYLDVTPTPTLLQADLEPDFTAGRPTEDALEGLGPRGLLQEDLSQCSIRLAVTLPDLHARVLDRDLELRGC